MSHRFGPRTCRAGRPRLAIDPHAMPATHYLALARPSILAPVDPARPKGTAMLRLSDSTDRAARPRARAAPLVDCAGLRRWPALWIAALAFVLYVPVAANVLLLGPDPLEYLDLARHVAAGDGYLLSIKAYYFDNSGVIHDGLAERAPLFTYLAAAILRLGLGYYALQVANALLSAGCAALVCAIGT